MAQKINIEGSQTISLTFGDAGENHVGNQMIGKLGQLGDGFTCDELIQLCAHGDGQFVDFGNDAGIAIFRQFVDDDMHNELFKEMNSFEWDQKYFDTRRKRVLNKHARTNVTFLVGDEQEPDYENGKGRIIDINSLPQFRRLRTDMIAHFQSVFDNPQSKSKFDELVCEGNNYYDNSKCGIGFHGDAERRRVIALRLGAVMPMKWQWFQNALPVGDPYEFVFKGGDLYIMSEKAVGTDWKMRKVPTLRHSAGCSKYTTIAPKKVKKDKV